MIAPCELPDTLLVANVAHEKGDSQSSTLLIAKLDRLARNVHFVSGLMESNVSFVACDLPEANQLTIHITAAFAEHETNASAKERGTLWLLRKLAVSQLILTAMA